MSTSPKTRLPDAILLFHTLTRRTRLKKNHPIKSYLLDFHNLLLNFGEIEFIDELRTNQD